MLTSERQHFHLYVLVRKTFIKKEEFDWELRAKKREYQQSNKNCVS